MTADGRPLRRIAATAGFGNHRAKDLKNVFGEIVALRAGYSVFELKIFQIGFKKTGNYSY